MSGRLRILHRVIDGIECKQCFRCKDWFPLKLFGNCKGRWDELRTICKECDSETCKAYYDGLTEKTRNSRKIRVAIYRKKNREKLKLQRAVYYKNNKTKILKIVSSWRKNNPEKMRCYRKKCRSTPKGHLSINTSKSMCRALKGNKAGRHWEEIVGYSLDQLYKRLRRTLPKGYVWQDYLDGKLHIDHKIPVSVFNFEKPEDDDFQRCFALKNLQLLPVRENIIKSNKLDKHFQPSLKF